MNFGVIFDLREPESPESVEEATATVRRWAGVQGVVIPDDAELKVVRRDADPKDWRTYPQLHVGFEWEGPPDSSASPLPPMACLEPARPRNYLRSGVQPLA
jgi:hypothetical protein